MEYRRTSIKLKFYRPPRTKFSGFLVIKKLIYRFGGDLFSQFDGDVEIPLIEKCYSAKEQKEKESIGYKYNGTSVEERPFILDLSFL